MRTAVVKGAVNLYDSLIQEGVAAVTVPKEMPPTCRYDRSSVSEDSRDRFTVRPSHTCDDAN